MVFATLNLPKFMLLCCGTSLGEVCCWLKSTNPEKETAIQIKWLPKTMCQISARSSVADQGTRQQ